MYVLLCNVLLWKNIYSSNINPNEVTHDIKYTAMAWKKAKKFWSILATALSVVFAQLPEKVYNSNHLCLIPEKKSDMVVDSMLYK